MFKSLSKQTFFIGTIWAVLLILINIPIRAQITEYIPEKDSSKANIYAIDTVNYISSDEMLVEVYIEKYKYIAILEMKRAGIPASITLAQGIMESRHGNSRLARKANNHFGIKCRSEWHGRRAIHNDEQKNECFRAYNSPIQSFIDHSNFLLVSPRYAVLFLLSVCDYKGWAQGLEELGYSTSGHYAEKISSLIETHHLNDFDRADINVTLDSLQTITLRPTEECYRKNLLQMTRPKKIRNKQTLSQQGTAAIEQLHKFHRFDDIYQNVAPSRDSILAILAAEKKPIITNPLPTDSAEIATALALNNINSAQYPNTNKVLTTTKNINLIENLGNMPAVANNTNVLTPTITTPQTTTAPKSVSHSLLFTYKTAQGDTLESIALQFKIDIEKIKAANPLISHNEIKEGECIKVPVE